MTTKLLRALFVCVSLSMSGCASLDHLTRERSQMEEKAPCDERRSCVIARRVIAVIGLALAIYLYDEMRNDGGGSSSGSPSPGDPGCPPGMYRHPQTGQCGYTPGWPGFDGG